jgi:hypothetical protein
VLKHRIAISDLRIIGIEDDEVHFRYTDYRDNQSKIMKLERGEFIRRFLMHILPKGLIRIRHHGLLVNCCRMASLKIIYKLLAQPAEIAEKQHGDEHTAYPCPKCRNSHLIAIYEIDRYGLSIYMSWSPVDEVNQTE